MIFWGQFEQKNVDLLDPHEEQGPIFNVFETFIFSLPNLQ